MVPRPQASVMVARIGLLAVALLPAAGRTLHADDARSLGELVARARCVCIGTVIGDEPLDGQRRLTLNPVTALKGATASPLDVAVPQSQGQQDLPDQLVHRQLIAFLGERNECIARYAVSPDGTVIAPDFLPKNRESITVDESRRSIKEIVKLREAIDAQPEATPGACALASRSDLDLVRLYAAAVLDAHRAARPGLEAGQHGAPVPAEDTNDAQNGSGGAGYTLATLGISALALLSFILVFRKCWREAGSAEAGSPTPARDR
ncbi:MAG TPA: hypothetical protein PLQ54_04470 [Armatimonadota bacterium]|nr:hypothetical protein [Armatimonadota bacterium]